MTGHYPRHSLSHGNFLVVGLARNCEKKVRRELIAIRHALHQCRALSWLIVESDSSDKTVNVLMDLQDQIPNFRVLPLGLLRESFPLRTQRIAHCRNVYLAELHSNPLYANVDYVIVADLDGVNQLLSASGISSCWDRSEWDVCAANQRGPYYDIWALRHPLWSPNDCIRQYDFLTAHGVRPIAAWQAAVLSKMITIAEESDWIEVESAFGGLAIYRRAALAGVQYQGLTDAGEEICEHIAPHKTIRDNGGRIFINPRLINTGATEHTRLLHLIPRVARQCRICLKHAKTRLVEWIPIRYKP